MENETTISELRDKLANAMVWNDIHDMGISTPGFDSQVLVTDGKICKIVNVTMLRAFMDNPWCSWTHWAEVKFPRV